MQACDLHYTCSAGTSFSVTTPPAGAIDPRRVGVRPDGAYWGAGGEQIDTRSGNLNFAIPLLKAMGRGGWGVTFALSYNSQLWRQDGSVTWKLGRDVGYGFGWRVQAGSLTPYWSDYYAIHHYVFTDASGAEYRLDVNSNGVWKSTESGVYVQYDSATRRLYFPDGSFWYMGATSSGLEDDAGTLYPTLMQDTNGNQVTVRYSYGGGTLIPDSSARIARIEDFRGPSGVSYVFGWADAPDLHISSISSQIGTSESWNFGIQLAARVSPFDSSDFGSEGALESLTRTGVNLSQSFTYDASGELTTLTTPLGGSFRWDYRSFTYSSGSRTLREVQNRYLTKAPNATETTYSFTYDDTTSNTVHASSVLGDPSGPARAWLFFTDGSGPFGTLRRYEARTAVSGTALHRRDFTYAQDSVGRNYIASVLTTIEPAGANLQSKTEQTVDDYGNVTQSLLYNYGNLTTPARTYTNTYLATSNYTARNIRNRLLTAQVTDGTNTVTLVTNTYDGGTLTNVDNLVAHDASYGTSFTYRGNLTHAVSPGSIRNFSYDIGGNAISSNDGYGHTLSSTYSTATQYTAPDKLSPGSDNLATTLTYTQFLGISTLTQPGATSSAQYDSYARPTQTTSPLGAVTYYTYDPNNPRLTTATTNTRIVKTTVDGLGRTVKVEVGDASSVKSVVDTEYDSCACSPLGKLKRVSRPYAPGGTVYWTTYTYDALGRTTQITLPDGSISTYAYSGNTTTVTDPGGKWKTYTSDALGNLLQVTEPAPGGGANHQTYYTYNLLGQLTQVQMPRGAVTQYRTFNYDLTTGRLTSATNPENGTVSYTYNADGTPLRKTDARSKAVEFSYDNYQRVTQKRTYPWGGSTEDPCGRVDFYYDTNPLESNWPSAWGRLMAMRWSNASCPGNQFTESYQYGAGNVVTYKRLRAPILTAGNYTSSTDNLDASFSYTTEGQLGQIHYPTWFNNGTPGLNTTLSYAFDTLRRPVSATDQNGIHWANNATYAPDGAPTAVTFVGAYDPGYDIYSYYNETRSYNVRGQLTRMTAGNYADLEYRFSATNNDGRLTQQKDWKSGKEINYEYDSLGRLSSAYTTGPQWGQSFTYDGFGNLTAEVATKGTAPTSYLNYNGTTNRIVTAGYGYDSSGNLTTMPDLTLTYDTDSRLTQAEHTTNGTERYGYDPLGRRVWKQWAGGGGFEGTYEVFFYGVKGELLASFQYAGGPSYSTGLRQGPMYYFAGRKFWTGTTQGNWEDRLGSKVNTSGTYFPYGDQPLTQYATYNRDATNLDYAQQRYYSSQIARFTTPDSYLGSATPEEPQSWNRYSYVRNDPANFLDPSGQYPIGADLSWTLCFGYSSGEGTVLTYCTVWTLRTLSQMIRAEPPDRPECNRKNPGNAKKLDWIAAHKDDAAKVAKELGVTTADILGLSALESAWGDGPFAADGLNNFFSQHAPAPLQNGTTPNQSGTVMMAKFASYADSAESFARQYGYIVKNTPSPAAFATKLQNAGKFGINEDGSKSPTFVPGVTNTINGLALRLNCED